MSYCKSSGYYRNVSFLMAFDILIQSGHKLMSVGNEEVVDLDIPKKDIYKAEKKIKEMIEQIKTFQEEELPIRVKKKGEKILNDIVHLSLSHVNISPEIIASHLLYNYFTQYEHPKMDERFSYFTNENNYFPILDRVHSSTLVDSRQVYLMVLKIIEENR